MTLTTPPFWKKNSEEMSGNVLVKFEIRSFIHFGAIGIEHQQMYRVTWYWLGTLLWKNKQLISWLSLWATEHASSYGAIGI